MVALRTPDLRPVQADDTTVALRLLADRRDQLAALAPSSSPGCITCCWSWCPVARTGICPRNRPARCGPLSTPRDVVGKTRRWLASELIHELVAIDKKIKVPKRELTELVGSTGSRLLQLHGIGPLGRRPAAGRHR